VADLYRRLTRILRDNGFELKRQAKGDHELWWNPKTRKHTLVDRNSKSQVTANFVLKKAGLPKAF
jgi:predicted RNA binding protein YcfA (HicA-like mRNA interferase family)